MSHADSIRRARENVRRDLQTTEAALATVRAALDAGQRRATLERRAAVELALAAPFLTRRDRARWRARVARWQRRASADAALLARLDVILARYTAGETRVPARRSA